MGPVSAKSSAGRALVQTRTRPAERARQEIDYGRRAKGDVCGAFCPATGEAFTHPYPGRGRAHWVDFLDHFETWIPRPTERVYAIMDNLNSHRTTDVLLFVLAHPRWEMVFQPKDAASLNLIEPWRVGASRPGTRSSMRSSAPPSTGMRTVIPWPGAPATGIAHAARPALPSRRGRHDLPDALLRLYLE